MTDGGGAMASVYVGRRDGDRVEVTVDGRPLDPRRDLRDFRAAGFEWGYEGSGPSQLALAILADARGDAAALGGYREFMRTMVADFAPEGWSLDGDDIARHGEAVVEVPMDLATLLRRVRGEP